MKEPLVALRYKARDLSTMAINAAVAHRISDADMKTKKETRRYLLGYNRSTWRNDPAMMAVRACIKLSGREIGFFMRLQAVCGTRTGSPGSLS